MFLSPYELIAVVTAIIYVVLAAGENVWCWFWGIISCSFWAYSAYFELNLYIDALLQLFYILISIAGIFMWKYGSRTGTELNITKMSIETHLLIIVLGFVISGLFGYYFDNYTGAAATYADALTTVFSVAATIMVVRKKIENWIYWIVIDIVYIFLYASRGGYLFAMLFLVYTIIAFYGYITWRKKIAT